MTYLEELKLETKNQFEIVDVTEEVRRAVRKSKVSSGSVVVFVPHSTAAVRINHNEPLLKQDLMRTLYRLAPVDVSYAHDLFEIRNQVKPDERSNGHAHVKAFLLGASETIPIYKGQMLLGERQNIFFVELDGSRKRKVIIQVLGE